MYMAKSGMKKPGSGNRLKGDQRINANGGTRRRNKSEILSSSVMNTKKVEDIIKKDSLGLKLHREEKIWFQNLNQVRKPYITFAMTDEELAEYIRCKRSVHYFAQNYCRIKREDGSVGPIKLRDYQVDMLNLFNDNRFSILMASRQTGKTISTSIFILWFALFHDDKGIMIVANKGKTVIEIMDKIKSIYMNLPFFLKKGVLNWTQRKITFDNGCRIQTDTRSKEPAIGFTIDLLYFDEFAHIPANIIEHYYRAAIPTISSIEDSKVIITSTPNGFNLFYRIWRDANREMDDPDKAPYSPLKVLWWQRAGRRDVWLYPNKKSFDKYKLNPDKVFKWLKNEGYSLYEGKEDSKVYTKIKFDADNEEKCTIEYVRSLRYDSIPFPELFIITSWKEEQIKLIGGEDSFKQEFDVRFMVGDKALFDDLIMEKLAKSASPFKHIQIPHFDRKLKISYESLTFIDKPEVFDIRKAKDYYIVGGIDFAEGLGKDYTVMNLFKVRLRDQKEIEKNRNKYQTFYDYFQLEQIGMFRSNYLSIKEFSHIFYLTCFELFDPEKCKISFEYNTFGGEFIAQLPNVFEGNNNYSNSVFVRYKHSQESNSLKLGVKINNNKKSFIKKYQDSIKNGNIVVHNERVIKEMETFTRQDTPSGDFTYKSESGNDDCVMSIVNMCSIFDTTAYKDIVEMYMNDKLSPTEKHYIENNIIQDDKSIAHSYSNIIGSKQKIAQTKEMVTKNRMRNAMMNDINKPMAPRQIPFGKF